MRGCLMAYRRAANSLTFSPFMTRCFPCSHRLETIMPNVHYAELFDDSAHQWLKLGLKWQQNLLTLPFINRVAGTRIYFTPGYSKIDIEDRLQRELKNLLSARRIQIQYHYSAESPSEQLRRQLSNPLAFKTITFGSDVAERDEHLLDYFISTTAFRHTKNRERSVIIGAKGSGKTAILRALASESPKTSITITPEVFATSMLKQFVDESGSVWDEDEAFVSTWIFTILVEVFGSSAAGMGLPRWIGGPR
jgi:hypothetical protein